MMISELLYKIEQLENLCNDGIINKECLILDIKKKRDVWNSFNLHEQG